MERKNINIPEECGECPFLPMCADPELHIPCLLETLPTQEIKRLETEIRQGERYYCPYCKDFTKTIIESAPSNIAFRIFCEKCGKLLLFVDDEWKIVYNAHHYL